MMLIANNEYLDFKDDIFMERQSKLFEQISETTGDFSYEFTIEDTAENRRKLGIQNINQPSKRVYQTIESSIVNSDNVTLYSGFLIVRGIQDGIKASFFSGNNNWMILLNGSIIDLDYSFWDSVRTSSLVTSTWYPENIGLIFPLIDKGGLSERMGGAFQNNTGTGIRSSDFHPFFYVKTIVKMMFQEIGVKITGDILNLFLYNNMIISSNRGEAIQARIDDRTAEVGRETSQVIGTSATKLILSDTGNFSDGSANLWDPVTSQYVADVDMRVASSIDINMSIDQTYTFEIFQNGVLVRTLNFVENASISIASLDMNPGDYLEYYITASGAPANLLTGSKIIINPSRFEYVYVSDYIPDLTKSEFISGLFQMFNIVATYNPGTKTLHTKLFKNIKNSSIDLSQYVDSHSIDYYEFIENYGKTNNFLYQQQANDDIEDYNLANLITNGSGVIDLDNDNIQDEVDVIELPFAAPYNYLNSRFNSPMARLNYTTTERNSDTEFSITSVTDNGSGMARFNVPGTMPLGILAGRVVELFNSSNSAYDGTGVLAVVTGAYFELVNVRFIDDATISFNLVSYADVKDSEAIILVNVFMNVSDFSSQDGIYVNGVAITTNLPFAYFDKINIGRNVDKLKYSLSFSSSTQIGLLEDYYREFGTMLTDPVKALVNMNLPVQVFYQLDSLEAVRVNVKDFTALFYLNRIRGYKSSEFPCEVDLIKLS